MLDKIKLINFLLPFTFAAFLFGASFTYIIQPDKNNLDKYREISDFADENEKCFKCHDASDLRIEDETENHLNERFLSPDQFIKREDFYKSNHRSLSCLDCHPDEGEQTKEPAEKQPGLKITCIDCHAYIENHQHYQFEKIEEEYL